MASPDTALAGKLAELSHRLGRRTPVVDQIAGSIRGMIVSGDLKPGDRVVESRIARQIGTDGVSERDSPPFARRWWHWNIRDWWCARLIKGAW
jgi:hypothetical protein